MNMVSGSAVFYCRGEQCLTTSSELSIGLDDIKESILFLHEGLLSADFTDGDEQNFIGYAKIFACLQELEYLKSDKSITNQTAK